jgi:flagellin-like protein
MNKRGISPLFATLLLIGFSIALGAVVMSYGQDYVEQQATFVQGTPEVNSNVCESVDLQLINVKGVPQLCVNGANVELSLDNGPGARIDALQARVVGTDNIALTPNILKQPIAPAGALKTMFSIAGVGTPQQIKLTPVLNTDAGQVFCPDKAILTEDVRAC